jgi:hypothetical protein
MYKRKHRSSDLDGYGDTLLNPPFSFMAIALPRTRVHFMARIARFVAAAASDRPSSWPASPAAIQGRKNEGQKPAIDKGIGKVSS